ncbi:MAG: TVP38/TMEM64 family protein [Microcoleaceae cyanobacterium]
MSKILKFILIAVGIAALIIGGKVLGIQQILINTLDWIKNLGTLGIAAFIVIYILATVLFIPGSLLTLGAGVLYGVVGGSVLVSVASTIAAGCAFLIGRYLARGWVSSKIEENQKFKVIDEAVAREGWKIVGLTRLSPIFPFNFLNYAFGLTKVTFKDYFLASWIGMMPGTVMYVYLGSVAGELATLGAEGRTRTTAEWILYGVGLVATVAVTIYVTKIAKKALNQKIEDNTDDAVKMETN